jgi:carbon monoxide dehydrogenase subunit G
MAIEIEERFQVEAPIERVWQFVMDPHRVAACMPGAKLEEVVDDKTFLGSIKIKIGAITTAYKGRVQMTEVDAVAYSVLMAAEGTETGGGTAKGTMRSSLRALDDGQTELVASANVDLTGRVMQVGSRMIVGVSHQLFKQFVTRAKKELEAAAESIDTTGPNGPRAAATVTTSAVTHARDDDDAISIVAVILRTIWEAIVNFFRRLFGRRPR